MTEAQIDLIRNEFRNDSDGEPEVEAEDVNGKLVVRLVNLSRVEIENRITEVRERPDEGVEPVRVPEDFIENNRDKILAAREDIIREFAITEQTSMDERDQLPKVTYPSKTLQRCFR